jgi:hypothetical protein
MPGHLQLQINAPAAPEECSAAGGFGVRALALYVVVELSEFCTEKVVICAASSGSMRCSWDMSTANVAWPAELMGGDSTPGQGRCAFDGCE